VAERDLTLSEIFIGATPYWIVLLVVVAAIAVFPQIATFLPNLGTNAAG
jgi:C4-dicarboxylate transporter DctM subunit